MVPLFSNLSVLASPDPLPIFSNGTTEISGCGQPKLKNRVLVTAKLYCDILDPWRSSEGEVDLMSSVR